MGENEIQCKSALHWISVKDRLPAEDYPVLVYEKFNDDSFIYTSKLYLGSWHCHCDCNDGSTLINVTHWMELPQVPR